jgi:hypothetical protein
VQAVCAWKVCSHFDILGLLEAIVVLLSDWRYTCICEVTGID